MGTLTFSYRSKKEKSNLQARLLFYVEGESKRQSIYTPTKIEVSKSFYDEWRGGKNFRDVEKANLKTHLDNETHELTKHVLNEFDKTETSTVDKDWLKKTVHEYYHPPLPEAVEVMPHSLLGYWDYYIGLRGDEMSKGYKKLFGTVEQKLKRFEKAIGQVIDIKDVDETFNRDFVEYCRSENYSQNTIRKDIKTIKTVCRHAKIKGVEVSPELDIIRAKNEKTPKIYLSFKELEKIKAIKGLPDYLDNARDWLIISCYTGQRVSDFMRFDKSKVRTSKGVKYLDIEQKKTGKEITIPLLPEVLEVLSKRNGNFPRPTSDVKYNLFIKDVCERAGLDTPTKGRLATIDEDANSRVKTRNVTGTYPKWQLVTSHIGRRSFATNYYGKLPTSYLKNITGHGTEAMLLAYIGKTSTDTAKEAYELMMNAKR